MVIVYTGNGKGKTTASMGIVLRASGYGRKVAVVQFFKNTGLVGELAACHTLLKDTVDLLQAGEGFYKLPGDKTDEKTHKETAQKAFRQAVEMVLSQDYFCVVLDELNVAVDMGLVKEEEVLSLIKETKKTHLVLTGRGATEKIVAAADLVTEMKEIKHPFQNGKSAVKGIDY